MYHFYHSWLYAVSVSLLSMISVSLLFRKRLITVKYYENRHQFLCNRLVCVYFCHKNSVVGSNSINLNEPVFDNNEAYNSSTLHPPTYLNCDLCNRIFDHEIGYQLVLKKLVLFSNKIDFQKRKSVSGFLPRRDINYVAY